jgi:hypothetical protein
MNFAGGTGLSNGQLIVIACIMLPLLALCLWAIVVNDKALTEQDNLRRELAQMLRDCDAIPLDAPSDDPALSALRERISAYGVRYAAWKRSPFVLSTGQSAKPPRS